MSFSIVCFVFWRRDEERVSHGRLTNDLKPSSHPVISAGVSSRNQKSTMDDLFLSEGFCCISSLETSPRY